MLALKEYAEKYLQDEMQAIQQSARMIEHPDLNIYEKAIIYYYSDRGCIHTNRLLRDSKGVQIDITGFHLNEALQKLPNYSGLVYRKVYLNTNDLSRYQQSFDVDGPIVEYAFSSTTQSFAYAEGFKGIDNFVPNCLFRILVKRGKAINKIAKFDEEEVIICPNTRFRVLEITITDTETLITMEEM